MDLEPADLELVDLELADLSYDHSKCAGESARRMKEAVKYCQKHDILKEFLKLHAAEVLGMLYAEWNLEDAIAVAREEGKEDEKLEIARNLLEKGSTLEFVRDITGLDIETIKNL